LNKWRKNYFPLFVRGGEGVFSRLYLAQMDMNTPLTPLHKRGNQIAFPFLKRWGKNYSPLFVRGGEGVFSRLYFAQIEGTPLYPLFIRGEIGLLFLS
ncbi:MAG: hypothetical protein ABFD07_18155, partial [Methanobacterium sp.]